jgi:hypothetical protein
MELERLEFKVVVDDTDSPDTEILARAASLDIASAAYMAAVAKYPNRNVQLRQGALIIRRNDGEPKPEPPRDPNLKSWSVYLIGGKKMQLLGSIEAVSEAAAIERAVVLFALDDQHRKRLAVNLAADPG